MQNQSSKKIIMFVLAALWFHSAVLLAADTATNLKIKPPGDGSVITANTSQLSAPKTTAGVPVLTGVTKASREISGTGAPIVDEVTPQITPVIPQRTVCRDFRDYQNENDQIQCVHRGGAGDFCPPGYRKDERLINGINVYHCESRHLTELYEGDPNCRWELCHVPL